MDKIGSASLIGTAAGVYGGLDQTPVCPLSSQFSHQFDTVFDLRITYS